MSSPTAHRSGLKILCAIASILHWNVRALDISQAFLQSENLRPEDRLVAIPPPMIRLPWTGTLAPPDTSLRSLPHSRRGFLLLRPLYGGRDAPMRWWITLPKRLRAHGFRQLRCDVCMFTLHNTSSQLIAYLVCHVDDILFTGTEDGLMAAEKVLRTFRAGDTENCHSRKTSFLLAFYWSAVPSHTGVSFCHNNIMPLTCNASIPPCFLTVAQFETQQNCELRFARHLEN